MEIVYSLNSVQIENYVFLIATTLLYYDHFLTLDQEIHFIWNRQTKFNWSCYLFILNRYFALLGNIVATASLFYPWFTESNCLGLELYHQLLQTLTQTIVSTVLCLRVYALYGRNTVLLKVLLGLTALATITYLVILPVLPKSVSYPPLIARGCHNIPDVKNSAKMAIGWIAILIFDCVLFGMTMFKAHQFRQQVSVPLLRSSVDVVGPSGPSLLSIIVRDGSIYFLIMMLANLVNIITYCVPGPFDSELAPLVGCISAMLTSRLILNLHRVTQGGLYSTFVESTFECAYGNDGEHTLSA